MHYMPRHPHSFIFVVITLLALLTNGVISTECTTGCLTGTYFIDKGCVNCPPGYYCPGGCETAHACPMGTFNPFENQSSRSACEPCEAGTYTTRSASPSCNVCPEGHYCTTNSTLPAICPAGHFCMRGAVAPEKCPPGSYAALPGQSACIGCGSSSISLAGATKCTCIGENRLHMSDGACRCKPGFASYISGKMSQIDASDADGRTPCEPRVHTPCAEPHIRDATGKCVDPADPFVCDAACAHVSVSLAATEAAHLTPLATAQLKAAARGYFDTTLRSCVCSSPAQDALCPFGDCASAPLTSLAQENAQLVLTMTDPLSQRFFSAPLFQLEHLFAPALTCSTADCPVQTVTATAAASLAHVGPSSDIATLLRAPVARTSASTMAARNNSPHARTVSLAIEDAHLVQPLTMTGAQPLSSVHAKPTAVIATISFAHTDAPAVANALVCLPLGGSLLWHLKDAYPVFAPNHALTTAALDYAPFVRLQQRVQAGIPTHHFAHTFAHEGSFVFTDVNGAAPLVVRVMPRGVACPAQFSVATTLDSAAAIALEILKFGDAAIEADLDLVYILMGVFLGASLLLAIFSKLTQYQARRARILFEMPDDTIARQNFRKLQQDLQQQQNDHKVMFQSELDNFRAECDRIAAETEQVKALLSVKITDSAGFLRAARNLIMAESTARQAYDHSQSTLERKVFRLMQDLIMAVKEQLNTDVVAEPGAPLPRASEKMCLLGGELTAKIAEMAQNTKRERSRRELLVKNSGIIGEELVNVMNQREGRIADLEGSLISRLSDYRETCLEPRLNDIITLDTKFATRTVELRKQRNRAVVRSVVLGFKVQVDEFARAMVAPLLGDEAEADMGVGASQLEPLMGELVSVRHAASNDTEQALLAVRKMITAATTKQKLAVFVGVPPELERALRLFLCQAGAAILGDNVLMGDIGLATEEKKAKADEVGHVDALQTLMFDAMDDLPKDGPALTGDIDSDIDILLGKITDRSIGAEDLKNLYSSFLRKQEMMEKIIADQKEQALEQAQEMLSMEISNNEDRAALDKATELLKTVMDQHEREKQELTARLNAEQEREMEREIEEQTARAAAENAKYEEERRRLEKELEDKRRGMVSGSDEEHASIAEHVLKLKKLEESKKEENNKYQQNLRDKHAQWKLKRQRELDALKLKQKAELKEREKEYQDTVQQIKERDNNNNMVVAGVDIAALAARIDGIGSSSLGSSPEVDMDDDDLDAGLVDDAETRAEKRKFLEELALQKKQDMQREHDEAKRRLEAELERERQEQMRAFEAEAARKREEALMRLQEAQRGLAMLPEDEGEDVPDESERTKDEGRRLMEKYEQDRRELERQLESEDAAQRSKLDAALRARAAQKQKLLQSKLDREKEEAEKARQDFEKNLIQREKKQKEEELLSHVIAEKGIDANTGATVIENVMAERQKRELVELMKQQRAEAAKKTKEMLDAAYADLFAKKQTIKAAKEEGAINAEEEQKQLRAIDQALDVETLKAKIEAEIREKHDRELKEARDQYTNEIKSMFGKLYGPDAANGLEVHRWEDKKELERRLREAEERKKAEEDEIRRKQEEVEAEIARMKEEAERLRQEQLKEEMAKVEEQMRRDKEEMERRLAEQEEKGRIEKEQRLAEREKQLKEEQDSALDEAEREAILKRYNEEVESRLVQDELEKKRQQVELQNRLKAREEQRKALAAKRAQDKVRRKLEESEAWVKAEEEAEKLREQELAIAQRAQEAKRLVLWKLVKAGKINALCRKTGVDGIAAVLQHTGKDELGALTQNATANGDGNVVAGLNKMLLPQPVKQAVLASLPASAKLYVSEGGMGGEAMAGVLDGLQDMLSSVVDSGDSMGDALEESLAKDHGTETRVSVEALSLREFMALRYAQWVVDTCADTMRMPSITVTVATRLAAPPVHLGRCLWRHSFAYEPASRSILVHRMRLAEVGSLSALMSAVCAHIAANSWAHSNKHVQAALAKCSQALFRELFWSKSYSAQSDLHVQPPVSAARAVGCSLSAKDPLEGHFEFVSGTNWRNAEAQWRAVQSALDKVAQEKESMGLGLPREVRVGVREDVIGDFVDVRMRGDVSGWGSLLKRLDAYKAFRETEQLRREVTRIEENVRYNLRGQDMAIEAGKGDMRSDDVDEEDDESLVTNDVAVLQTRRERLRAEADALHVELVDVVAKAHEAARQLAQHHQSLAKNADKDPTAEDLLLAAAHRDTVRRLAAARIAVLQRVQQVEAQVDRVHALIVAVRGDKEEHGEAKEEEKE